MSKQPLCKATKADGSPCKAYSTRDSDYCTFHNGDALKSRGFDLSKAVVETKRYRKDRTYRGRYRDYWGGAIGDRPRVDRLIQLEKFYDDGGIIATAIDSYVSTAVANGFQLIDTITGERETDNTNDIFELDARINMHDALTKIFRSLLIYGFCWGEMEVDKAKKVIKKLIFLPPYEIAYQRKKNGDITLFQQVKAGKIVAQWKEGGKDAGKKVGNLTDVFFIQAVKKHSEKYPVGLLERCYNESKAWKEQGDDLGAVTKFVSYPFRIVKVGSDNYPASEAAVTKVGDEVEKLEPGDWLATRHNLEFEFHAPEVPDAIVEQYKEKTRELIVTLGVPSLYVTLEDIDAKTLEAIRDMFNATVQSLQKGVKEQFERQIFKKQFDLLGKSKKRTDKIPAQIVFNPLTVAVLSILELTQLAAAGVIGIEEARRVLESMGYGLLRGDKWKETLLLGPLQNPKQTHPTKEDPNKPPNKPPAQAPNKPPTKDPSKQPIIKKPQPNAPKMAFMEWLEGIKVLKEIDKFAAYTMLAHTLNSVELDTESVNVTMDRE
jgi:hypothetical protein